jgi:hypothetical protein
MTVTREHVIMCGPDGAEEKNMVSVIKHGSYLGHDEVIMPGTPDFVEAVEATIDKSILAKSGSKGGKAGTGDSKKRGDSEHYKKMRAAREAKRVGKK